MATAVEPRPTKDDAAVERSIASAAAKVRLNDLLTGGAALVVLALAYVALTMVLDKWLALPAWARQLGFAGFLLLAAAVAYYAVVVPFRRRVNPRYIARQVEQTIPDAKNVLINWVDLHDRELPGSVKTAVAARAADGLADADVDTATTSRRLLWLGVAAGVLVAVLAVLFLLFKWTQFTSLVGRAVNPFANTAIASRTQIDLLDPTGGDATVTDGEQMNVAVRIGGRVPDPNGPEKPRLLVRHNPDAAGYDELPLARGESAREFALMVPRSVIQNGFWYKVAAGDAETPEYRVTVRTRAMLTGFEARYEYPAYLKWGPAVGTNARLSAIRGTVVTLTVTTNREVKFGTLTTATAQGIETIRGEVTGKNDALRFKLKLSDSGTYRVNFQPTGAEPAFASTEYPIEVEVDKDPEVRVIDPNVKDERGEPKEKDDKPVATLPPNGLLAVDARIRDDHGLTAAALRLELQRSPGAIPPKKYLDGEPLVKLHDGSDERRLPYQDSIRLDKLTDDKGRPLPLKEGDTLVYWVEATDNCTEPAAHVGASRKYTVRIVAPPPPPPPNRDPKQPPPPTPDEQEKKRKGEEQKNQQQEDQRRRNETRPPEESRDPDPEKQPQQPQDQQQPGQQGDKKEGDAKQDQPQKGGDPGKQDTNPMGNGNPNEKNPDTKPENDKTDKPEQPKGGGAKGPNDKTEKNPDTKPDGTPQDQKGGSGSGSGGKNDQDLQKQADQLQEKIDQQKSEASDAKGDGSGTPQSQETKPDAGAKSQPKDKQSARESGPAAEKGGEKSGEQKAGEGKDGGTLTEPDRTESKAGPKPDAKQNERPTDDKTKPAPKEGDDSAAKSKESKPEEGNAQNGDKKDKQDSAGAAKGAQPEKGDKADKTEQPMGGADSKDKTDAKDPNDLSGAKEKGTPERATTKKEEKGPKGGDQQQPRKDEKGDGGEAKADKPAAPGAKKDAQPGKKADGTPMDQKGPPQDASQEKGPPKQDAADPTGKKDEPAADKDAGQDDKTNKATTKPPMTQQGGKKDGGGKPEDKKADAKAGGTDQKDPKTDKQPGGGKDQKLDPKEMEKAVRELDSENAGTRKDAQDKLDKSVGKEHRDTVERLNRDLKSGDPKRQEDAKKEIDELAKKSGQPKPRELTAQEKKELAELAKNLNSKDKGEREAAEKKLDSAVGEEKRKEIQEQLKDLTGDDPQKAKAAREKLEQMAKEAKNGSGDNLDERTKNLGGGNSDKKGQPIEADLANQLKTQELQLNEFKKYRGNKEFLKENNYTPEEYDRFVNGYEEMVNRKRDELDQRRLNPTADAKPSGPATIRNTADTTERLKSGAAEAGSSQGPGGASVAPPGFTEAQKRYAERAAKREAEKKK